MSSTPRFGSVAWAAETGGTLSRGDRIVQLTRATGPRLAALLARVLPARDARRLDPDAIGIPDSTLAAEAAELCRTHSSPALTNHCYRAYAWGTLLAQAGELRFDRELFYVAAILHDIALTEAFGVSEARPQPCFAHRGALVAESFATERGWSAAKARELGDAICLHLNVRVAPGDGVEAHLVRQGSALDVIGARIGEIARADRAAVLERWPRLGFTAEIARVAREEARRHRGCRMHFLVANGFAKMIDNAPFSE